MLTQTLPIFQYQNDSHAASLTGFAGLPLYINLIHSTGLAEKLGDMSLKKQGWSDFEILMSLLLLNLVGGNCVSDINHLEEDSDLRRLLLASQTQGLSLVDRIKYQKRWRQTHSRAFPSTDSIHRYLTRFHNEEAEQDRVAGKAFIPEAMPALEQLKAMDKVLIDAAQQHNPSKIATLDQDATLCPTHKRTALYSYKKMKAYQPFNTYWYEKNLLLHSEFRDGNVNAEFNQLHLLKTALDKVPAGVEKVLLRSDSAGYQEELIQYCGEGENPRFGVIGFAISAHVSTSFKALCQEMPANIWHPLYDSDGIKTNQEWADVPFNNAILNFLR